MTDFQREFDYFVAEDNLPEANRVLMTELGRLMVRERMDFVDLLNESGVPANPSMSDAMLVDLFVQNVGTNKALMTGAAFYVNYHNKTLGFDGDTEVNDEAVKDAYAVLFSSFCNFCDDEESDEEDKENFAGWGQAIGGIVSKGADFGQRIYQDQRRKKHGATDEFYAQQEAKRQMLASIMEQRRKQQELEQQKIEARRKTTRTLLIVGGGVVAVGLVIGVIYALKKKK